MGGNDLLSCSGRDPKLWLGVSKPWPTSHWNGFARMVLERWRDVKTPTSKCSCVILESKSHHCNKSTHVFSFKSFGGSKIPFEVSEQFLGACHVCGRINLKKIPYLSPPAQAKRLQWIHFPTRLRCATWQHGSGCFKNEHPTPIKWMYDKVLFLFLLMCRL